MLLNACKASYDKASGEERIAVIKSSESPDPMLLLYGNQLE
jgi:hypothetical protein